MCSFEVSPWLLRASGLETGVKIGLPVGNDGVLDQCYHNRGREKEIWDMFDKEWKAQGNSLAVQWLGLCAFTAEGLGSVPGQETKIPQADCPPAPSQKKRKEKNEKHKQGLLYARHSSNALHNLTHLMLTKSLCVVYYYQPHFTIGKMEVQRD